MKNSKIHLELPNQDLRDFLGMAMVKNYEQEFVNKKRSVRYDPSNETIFEYAIKDCENEIAYQNKRLELLKEKQSILTLIKMQGWEEFDVSDETIKDLKYRLHMSFIGTKYEYNTLIKTLANEN